MDELEVDDAARVDDFDDEDDRSSMVSSLHDWGRAGGTTPGRGSEAASGRKPPKKTEAKRRCRLCQKWLPEDTFPINSAYCRECKQAVDNLAKQALRQSEGEWWKKIRNEEPELRKLVAKYMATCPKNQERGKRGVFNLVSYREVYTASSTSSAKARGRMMWEGYYVEFAQKPKGGSHSESAARQRWKEMVDDPTVEKDEQGPAHAPKRCLVPMFDEVSHGSKLSHAKTQELQSKKDTKNVSAEQAAKDRRLLLQGHERGALNKNGEALDFVGAVSGMLANSACGLNGKLGASGSAFAGKGAFIPDIKVLKEELDDDEPMEQKDPEAASSAAEGSGANKRVGESPQAGQETPAKKIRWFDVAGASPSESQASRSLA